MSGASTAHQLPHEPAAPIGISSSPSSQLVMQMLVDSSGAVIPSMLMSGQGKHARTRKTSMSVNMELLQASQRRVLNFRMADTKRMQQDRAATISRPAAEKYATASSINRLDRAPSTRVKPSCESTAMKPGLLLVRQAQLSLAITLPLISSGPIRVRPYTT